MDAKDAKDFKDLHSAGLESFEVVEVHRSQLKNAPYNPRTLSETNKRKLKAGLKRHGLVSPLTWNEQTGYIVGGHQRISIMDSLMGTSDYTLKVARISVPSNKEKELNILLNNNSAMGDWDIGALGEMLDDKSLVLDGTGFDAADVYKMFGEAGMTDRSEDMAQLGEQLRDIQAQYGKISERNDKKNSEEFYLVVVFEGEDELTEFLVKHNLPDNRYQSGRQIDDMMIQPETPNQMDSSPAESGSSSSAMARDSSDA